MCNILFVTLTQRMQLIRMLSFCTKAYITAVTSSPSLLYSLSFH